MSKQHRDFCIYVRNGVAINALVAISRDVYSPATQTEPAKTIEHLTLVYLDPSAASNTMTGDQLRNSIKTEFDVAPLGEGVVTGWKDIIAEVVAPSDEAQGSGSERYGGSDWTAVGQDVDGFPVPKGSPEDVTTPTVPSPKDPVLANPLPNQTEAIAEEQVAESNPDHDGIVGPDGLTDSQRGFKWGSDEHKAHIAIAEGIQPEDVVQNDPEVVQAVAEANTPTE